MRLGYARVSTQDQDTTAQRKALKAANCDRVFQEKASGGRWERTKLQELLGQQQEVVKLVSTGKKSAADATRLFRTLNLNRAGKYSNGGRMPKSVKLGSMTAVSGRQKIYLVTLI